MLDRAHRRRRVFPRRTCWRRVRHRCLKVQMNVRVVAGEKNGVLLQSNCETNTTCKHTRPETASILNTRQQKCARILVGVFLFFCFFFLLFFNSGGQRGNGYLTFGSKLGNGDIVATARIQKFDLLFRETCTSLRIGVNTGTTFRLECGVVQKHGGRI